MAVALDNYLLHFSSHFRFTVTAFSSTCVTYYVYNTQDNVKICPVHAMEACGGVEV